MLFDQDDGAPVEIDWLPNYQILKEAVESYGFKTNSSQDVKLAEAGGFPLALIVGFVCFMLYNRLSTNEVY